MGKGDLLTIFFSFLGALLGGGYAARVAVLGTRRQRLEDAYVSLLAMSAEIALVAPNYSEPPINDADSARQLLADWMELMTRLMEAKSRALLLERSEACRALVSNLTNAVALVADLVMKRRQYALYPERFEPEIRQAQSDIKDAVRAVKPHMDALIVAVRKS